MWLKLLQNSKLHFLWPDPHHLVHRVHLAVSRARLAWINQVMQGCNICWLNPPSRCPISSQVSRAWRVLAEDDVLWFKMCTGEGYHQDASVSDSPCWKSTLRDCRNSAKAVCSNWKVGSGCSTVVNQNHCLFFHADLTPTHELVCTNQCGNSSRPQTILFLYFEYNKI